MKIVNALTALLLLLAVACPVGGADGARDAAAVQEARNKSIAQFSKKKYYTPSQVSVDDLPHYVPQQKVSGPIRIWGSDMFGGAEMKQTLQDGFRKFHPNVTFEFNLKGPAFAFAGLLTNSSDIGPSRRISWESLLAFQRTFSYDPLVIIGMTGWAVDPPFVIVVNKDNPIAQLSMKQLDGIFGSERNGGWVGTAWHPEFARGPEENIRNWGQLGLGGEWANQTINVYGYGLRYLFSPRFSDDVLKSSDKWNASLKQYVNYATPEGTLKSADQQIAEAVAKDRYAIGYYSLGRGEDPQVKVLSIGVNEAGPYVQPSLEAVRAHAYPLYDEMYFYLNRKPGTLLDPKLKEFMRFVLSREGQEIVLRDTTMLPLNATLAREELKKLD